MTFGIILPSKHGTNDTVYSIFGYRETRCSRIWLKGRDEWFVIEATEEFPRLCEQRHWSCCTFGMTTRAGGQFDRYAFWALGQNWLARNLIALSGWTECEYDDIIRRTSFCRDRNLKIRPKADLLTSTRAEFHVFQDGPRVLQLIGARFHSHSIHRYLKADLYLPSEQHWSGYQHVSTLYEESRSLAQCFWLIRASTEITKAHSCAGLSSL